MAAEKKVKVKKVLTGEEKTRHTSKLIAARIARAKLDIAAWERELEVLTVSQRVAAEKRVITAQAVASMQQVLPIGTEVAK